MMGVGTDNGAALGVCPEGDEVAGCGRKGVLCSSNRSTLCSNIGQNER